LSRAIEFVTPAVNPKANSALWVVMMCTLVQDADGGCVWGEGGSGDRLCRKSLYFMLLFTVKLNLLEIIKSLKKKKKQMGASSSSMWLKSSIFLKVFKEKER
jgi:hypothetical protein